jgi:beta-glucosidase
VRPEPGTPEARADGVDALRNRVWTGPLAEGRYDDGVLGVAPELADADLVRDGDLDAVRGSATWLGVNYYTPIRPGLLAPDATSSHPEQAAYPGVPGDLDLVVREPRTDIGWEVDATGLSEVLRTTHERTGLPLVVTENGAAYADPPVVDGVVDDQDRIGYLRDHLAAADAVRADGVDLRGYFVWTLLDNFEWAEGYTKTFGLVHVDRTTSELGRTPKASYHWLREQAAVRREP